MLPDLCSPSFPIPELICDETLADCLTRSSAVRVTIGVPALDSLLSPFGVSVAVASATSPDVTAEGPLPILELVSESGIGKSRIAYAAIARVLAHSLPPDIGTRKSVEPPLCDGRPHAVLLDCDGKFNAQLLAALVLEAVACRRSQASAGTSADSSVDEEAILADCLSRCIVVHAASTPECVAAVEALAFRSKGPRSASTSSGGGAIRASDSSMAVEESVNVGTHATLGGISSRSESANTSSSATWATTNAEASTDHRQQQPPLLCSRESLLATTLHSGVKGPIALLVLDGLAAFYWQDKAWRNSSTVGELYGRLGEGLKALMTKGRTRVLLCRPLLFGLGSESAALRMQLRTPVGRHAEDLKEVLLGSANSSDTSSAPSNRLEAVGGGLAIRKEGSDAATAATVAPLQPQQPQQQQQQQHLEQQPLRRGAVLPEEEWLLEPHVSAEGFAELIRTTSPYSFAKALLPYRLSTVLLTRVQQTQQRQRASSPACSYAGVIQAKHGTAGDTAPSASTAVASRVPLLAHVLAAPPTLLRVQSSSSSTVLEASVGGTAAGAAVSMGGAKTPGRRSSVSSSTAGAESGNEAGSSAASRPLVPMQALFWIQGVS